MIALAELVPLALVIAINPMPVIAVLLMLSTPGGLLRSTAFASGWMIGTGFATTVFSYLSSLVIAKIENVEPWPIVTALPLVLGALLVIAGVVSWRRRSPEAAPPKWMTGLERLGAARSGGIAFAFATLKPKNVALTAAAGVIILAGEPSFVTVALMLVIFTLVASSTLIVPIVLYQLGGRRSRAFLNDARRRLTDAMPAITSIALVVLGVAIGAIGAIAS